jgi:hypothetical protein
VHRHRSTRTLLERRQAIVRLFVWLRLVERNPDRDDVLTERDKTKERSEPDVRAVNQVTHLKCRFELRIKVDRLLHRIIVQLVCENDTSLSVECTPGCVSNKPIVVCVNSSGGNIVQTDMPVIRVILPKDRLQTKCIGDCANAVLHQDERRRYHNVFPKETGKRKAYINVSKGRSPAGWSDASDEFDSLHLLYHGKAYQDM